MDLTCRPQIHHIPRDLGLDEQGRLTISPIPEIAGLRIPSSGMALSREQVHSLKCQSASRPCLVGKGSSLQLQLNCSGVPTGAAPIVGLEILATPDGSHSTHVGYAYATQRLFVDHSHASPLRPSGVVQTAPLADGPGEQGVLIDVLVDQAMVEAFVNRRAVLSSFVAEVMADTAPKPEERLAFMLPPPPGVSCEARSWSLAPLVAGDSSALPPKTDGGARAAVGANLRHHA